MEQDTLAMQPSSKYALVDSLYGPGTVIAWLLTTFSILINWTLHTKSRHEDTITVDLAATLVFPIVAAGHLISQIHRLSTPVSEVMTSTHIDDMGIVAAFEAPLNICETFSWVSLILVLPCIYWSSDPDEKEHLLHFGAKTRLKRFGLVTCVGLISLSMEVFLFATTTARGIQVGNTTLSRPYVFQSFILLVASWVFVIVCFCILGGGMLVHRLSERSSHGYKEKMRTDRVAVPMKIIGLIVCVYMPGSFGIFIALIIIEFRSTGTPFTVFFIPKSQSSVSNLDQAVAMATGIVILLFTLFGVYKSQTIHTLGSIERPTIEQSSTSEPS
jgi:hypothetical protein